MRLALLCAALLLSPAAAFAEAPLAGFGPRPAYLVSKLPEGALKEKLQSCAGQQMQRTAFSIGHRGAPLMFPEHTVESNRAAAAMGAGILECDVTFTSDLELVCRHAQNDLHTTTNILLTPLAGRCIKPFTPAGNGSPARAECRTSELTLEEFRSLAPKMDSQNKAALTPEDYQGGLPGWRTALYDEGAQLMTHAESIELFRALGAKFMPELKAPKAAMPFNGFTREDYAQKLVDEYRTAGVPPADVWLQSFDLADIRYWIRNTPEFGRQAVYLDGRYRQGLDPARPASFHPSMAELKEMGVNYIAPPMWMLIAVEDGRMVPSPYARAAREAGLQIIAWSMERSGPLENGGGWYFQSAAPLVRGSSAYYQVLDVLAQDVGVAGVFSDWPATVTYYANCMGL